MSPIRALRYARRYRNWRELERERAAGRAPRRAILRGGVSLEAPEDVNLLSVVREVFFRRYYTPRGFEIGERDVVVDIGANIGAFTVYAALRTRRRVLAVEPHPENLRYLERNLRANGCESAEVAACALTDRDGPVTLQLSPNGACHQLSDRAFASTRGSIEVPAQRLETVLEQRGLERIDLLKLDCEGAEGQILGSASPECLARIRRVALEFHDDASPLSHAELAALLGRSGFATRLEWNGRRPQGYLFAWR